MRLLSQWKFRACPSPSLPRPPPTAHHGYRGLRRHLAFVGASCGNTKKRKDDPPRPLSTDLEIPPLTREGRELFSQSLSLRAERWTTPWNRYFWNRLKRASHRDRSCISSHETASTMDSYMPRDPRTLNWAFVGNKYFLASVLFGYIYFVKIGGPRFMRNRKAYDNLKPIIIFHNAMMVLLNVYFGTSFLKRSYWGGGYDLVCQGIDFNDRSENTTGFLVLAWWYLWVRIADFLDSVFFVLRKKDSNVSFMHVVHHALVVFCGWFGLAYGADGQIALTLVLNSYVHAIMNFYYLLSLLGPAFRPYLWWKRYLTQVQIGHFFVIICHVLTPLYQKCGYPQAQSLVVVPQVLLICVLFLQYYWDSYKRRVPAEERRSSATKSQ